LKQTLGGTKEKINAFSSSFKSLKMSFDTSTSVQTAIISSQILTAVKELSMLHFIFSFIVNLSSLVAEMEILKLLKQSEMDASMRSQCLPGTRENELGFILNWLLTPSSDKNILWLHGVAGSGKSVLATTVSQYFQKLGRRGAFLFFTRNNSFHSHPDNVICTLAYQLANFNPVLGSLICDVLKRNKDIVSSPLSQQAEELLEPLTSELAISGPIVIVLDSLDECGDASSRRTLLRPLLQQLAKIHSIFRILITSRAEHDLDSALSSCKNVLSRKLEINSESNKMDINKFLSVEMKTIQEDSVSLSSDWPGDEKIRALTHLSSGLWIWASTAVKYVHSYTAEENLDAILSNNSEKPENFDLNSLYALALGTAGEWNNEKFKNQFSLIMSAILTCRTPLATEQIDDLLGLNRKSSDILTYMKSVIYWESGKPVQILHASFGDYLVSAKSCESKPWYIDLSVANERIATACFTIMKNNLSFNICKLETSYYFNEDIPDINEKVEKWIPFKLQYACKYWGNHLHLSQKSNNLRETAQEILSKQFLFWLEVLSLTKTANLASPALLRTIDWNKVRLIFK
jgi:hypothetical protein